MKITPADSGAAKAFEWHLDSCPWPHLSCDCKPRERLAAAFAAHRLEHGDDGLEYRIIKLERELGALRSVYETGKRHAEERIAQLEAQLQHRRPYTTAELSNMKTGGMG